MVQIERTATALARCGLQVLSDFSTAPELDGVDLVHGFGLTAAEIRRCHTRRVPVAVSTIYWDRAYRSDGADRRPGVRTLAGRGVRAARFARAALQGRSSLLEASLRVSAHELDLLTSYEAADLLLPNADGEGESIRRDLGVTTPTVTIPNGVDPEAFTEGTGRFEDRDCVLFLGRIEPHKNQLGAIVALRDSGLPLVIAGHDHPDHPEYARRCRAEGGPTVTFTGPLGTTSEVARLFHRARVHLLPSWFETTGLVSLEAALSGCNVVSTSRGHAREYLADLAWYCDPAQPGSILEAVRRAWDTPPSPALRQRVLERYTWERVAEATVAAYRSLLDGPAVAGGTG